MKLSASGSTVARTSGYCTSVALPASTAAALPSSATLSRQDQPNATVACCELNDSLFVVSANGMLTKIYQDSIYYTEKAPLPGKTILWSFQHTPSAIFFLLNDGAMLC